MTINYIDFHQQFMGCHEQWLESLFCFIAKMYPLNISYFMTFSNSCKYDTNDTLHGRAYTLHTYTVLHIIQWHRLGLEAGDISQLVPSVDSHRKQSGKNVPLNGQSYSFFSVILLIILGQLLTSGNTLC